MGKVSDKLSIESCPLFMIICMYTYAYHNANELL